LFTARVDVLEACHEYCDPAKLLIVEEETEGKLYAVERVKRHQYALCRLGHWVKKDDVKKRAAIPVQSDESQKKRHARQPLAYGQPWWTIAAAEVNPLPSLSKAIIPQLSVLVKTDSTPSNGENMKPDQPAADQLPEDTAQSATPDEVLEELAKQYMEALYLSRMSLAYFVKGPVARARAAFSSHPNDLITFLRDAVLPVSVIDKKYRDGIPEIIKAIPALETPQSKTKSKRKRKWKAKRDKTGFFVGEGEFIEPWWLKDDEASGSASTETLDSEVKRRSQRLRNRETFLQLILVLEALAMEASVPPPSIANAPADAQKPGPPGEELRGTTGEKKTRKKKEVDMCGMLETLVERLNIYYSLDFDSPVMTKHGENGSANPEAKDELKTFCTEVIIPFFAPRIHDTANSASKKLGGPSAPDPMKRKTTTATRRPGEMTSRDGPEKKSRKPLSRSATDTFNHRKSKLPASLQRSATDQDSLAPLIKRERSASQALSLKDIPAANSKTDQTGGKKRPSLMEQYSKTNRQVDFSAMAQANEAKIRRKNEVDEKLRDALKSIGKPNRTLATEETAKVADESFARAIAKGKSTKPHRSSAATKVTVTATPRHVKATPAATRRRSDHIHHPEPQSSAGSSIVPSSSAKLLAARPDDVPESAFKVPQTVRQSRYQNVDDTPSRGFAKFMPAVLSREPGTLLESPTAARTAPIAATPAKPRRMPSLQVTPVAKERGTTGALAYGNRVGDDDSPQMGGQREDSGLGFGGAAVGGGKSIYKTLGWDDDYDELC
jgi:hypothetical protein